MDIVMFKQFLSCSDRMCSEKGQEHKVACVLKWFEKTNNFDPPPMPKIDEVLNKLGKAKYISKLDLTKGYWQIPVSEECFFHSVWSLSVSSFAIWYD